MPIIPILWILGGSVGVAGLMAASKTAESVGDAAEQSTPFMTRVVVLSLVGGACYALSRV